MADWTNSAAERKKKMSSIGQKLEENQTFRYDPEKDPAYRQMADRYVQMGQLANRNAQGQAAALTGGYGNSFGAQVGNQMYQQYLTALNDQLPNLQANAQNAWAADYDRMLQLYQMMAAMGTGTGRGGTVSTAPVNPTNTLLQGVLNALGGKTMNEQMENMYADWLKRTQAASEK